MSEVVRKNLGAVTAYKYAVSKGYTGTEEEFAELMASYATVAEEAAESANTAAEQALKSEGNAVGKQNGTDVSSGSPYYHNNAKYYAEQAASSASSALSSSREASTSATNAASSERSASSSSSAASMSATQAASSAGTASAKASSASTSANSAAASATAAATSETNAAASATAAEAAQAGAEAVLESIPEDYSTLSAIAMSTMPTVDTLLLDADTTVNLLDDSTITSGYLLISDVPSENSSYYYSDYIKVGMMPFYHSQGGTVTCQVSCYDKDKSYIGYISYNHNADHYEAFNAEKSANLRYCKFTPLDGTVYIRVNGATNRPKMVTPFFSPMQYGAVKQNLPYGKAFRKYSLKVAMFGDSITLGRDGNSSDIISENMPFYIEKLTGWQVDNYGVGSMGWVSTQYTDQIAYDKISATTLTDYDIITLCYGVNDTQATLGTWDSTDETTICGQINKCIKYIFSQNNKARVILIAPFNTGGSGGFPDWRYPVVTAKGWSRKILSETEKQIADYYHIPFVSQDDSPYMGFGLGNENGRTYQFCGTDNVHPTADGYVALGHWITAKLMDIVR